MFTPVYSPRSNGRAKRAVQTLKTAMKTWSPNLCTFETFLLKVLFNLRNTPSGPRDRSPAEILLSQPMRMPIVEHRFKVGETVRFSPMKEGVAPRLVKYVVPKGRNTAWVQQDNGAGVLVSASQISPAPVEESDRQPEQPQRHEDIPREEHVDVKEAEPSAPERRALRCRQGLAPPERYGFPP